MTTTQDVIKTRRPNPRYPVIKLITERFSPRFFTGEVKDEDLNSIFEAARWTPSAYNYQPWFFYWAKNSDKSFNNIIDCLPEFNQWAKTAAVLIIACYIDKNENGKIKYARYDLGASVISLILQAQSLGYYARQMAVFDKRKLKTLIKFENFHEPYIVVALGKLGDYRKIDKQLLQRELNCHSRKPQIARKL